MKNVQGEPLAPGLLCYHSLTHSYLESQAGNFKNADANEESEKFDAYARRHQRLSLTTALRFSSSGREEMAGEFLSAIAPCFFVDWPEGERMTERHRRLVLLKVAWSFKDPIVCQRGRGGRRGGVDCR